MSSIYIPTSSTSSSATKDYVDQSIQPLAVQLGTATSNNTPSTIVKCDGNGDFSGGVFKATSLEVSGTTKITMPLKDSAGANILQMVGTNNVLVGKNTMPVLSSGTNNVVVGNNSGVANTSGSFNTRIGTGVASLGSGTTGWNSVVGNEALANISTGGVGNVAMENKALYLLTSGENNTAIGMSAGYSETLPAKSAVTGRWGTFIGSNACPLTNALNNVTAIGYQATVDADNTIQLGNTSVTAVKTSGTLYAAGLESIGTNSTLNIASQNNTNTVNIGSGTGVQAINVGNSGTGKTTIKLGGGTDEVQVNLPLKNASGVDVLTVGSTACFVGNIGNPSGIGNTFVGVGISTTAGKFGTYNTGMGNLTLAALDTGGDFNVAMGFQALGGVTTGQYNVAVGTRAGWDPLPAKCQITGTGCTFIGTDSKPNSVTPLINATAIGSQAIVDASNTIQLGHAGLVAVKTNGTITAATPTTGSHLTTKTYVDDKFTTLSNQNLKTTDVVTFGGLKLPTTGGTASTLNYYEEYTYQTKFTGAISETANITVQMVRVGKQVTLTLKANGNSAYGVAAFTSALFSMTNFPARFYPDTVEDTVFMIPTRKGASVFTAGRLRIPANAGMLYITKADDGDFIAGQSYGVDAFSISWVIS